MIIMTKTEVADISSYQDDSLAFMQSLGKYAKGLIIKITEGSETGDAYVNPKAKNQVLNGLKVFKSVGAYHYFKANSQKFGAEDPVNEAKWFIKNLVKIGLNKDTVCALDVEDSSLMQSTTKDVNTFLQYMNQQGYKNLVVYASQSWFTSGRVDKDKLLNKTPIWVAAYGTNEPGVDNASAWQYTDNGHGLNTDFSYDFDGTLLGDQKNNATGNNDSGSDNQNSDTPKDDLHVHAQQVYEFFNKKGLSDAAICGILANFQHESGINPDQWQIGMPHTWSMSSSTGYGIAQFTPAGKIKAYADKVGKSVSDMTTQLDFIWSQITATGGFSGGGKTLTQFAHDTDPKVAALDFLQGYEMHSKSTDALADRQSKAASWWAIYNKGNAGTYGDGGNNSGGGSNSGNTGSSTADKTPEGYSIKVSGTFTFNTRCKVRKTPEMSAAGLATYGVGQSVNYDSKYKNDDHFWLSYLGASGTRVYVPYANISKGTYFGQDTKPGDPIKK